MGSLKQAAHDQADFLDSVIQKSLEAAIPVLIESISQQISLDQEHSGGSLHLDPGFFLGMKSPYPLENDTVVRVFDGLAAQFHEIMSAEFIAEGFR